MYPDFVPRFIIIKPKEVHAAMPDLKESTKIILSSIEAMNDKWRLGHTKVFFRAGAGKVHLTKFTEFRFFISKLQSAVLKKLARNASRRSSITSKA